MDQTFGSDINRGYSGRWKKIDDSKDKEGRWTNEGWSMNYVTQSLKTPWILVDVMV